MRLFRKTYEINPKELNLEFLNVKNVNDISNIEIEAFEVSSLGFFNQVVAKFEKNNSDIKLKIELPAKLYYFQMIPIVLFLALAFQLVYSGEENSVFLALSIPVIIIFMGFIYQREFLKESKEFYNNITTHK